MPGPSVLGQLGNRVQHALRAFTPRDQQAVKTAAETFRPNPRIDVVRTVTELAVGEALVSFLDGQGTPAVVERALVHPPRSRLAPLSPAERAEVTRSSPIAGHYESAVDRESAYEKLKQRAPAPPPGGGGGLPAAAGGVAADMLSAMAKSAVRAAGTQIGRQIMRGVLGSLFGGRR